VQTRRDQVQAHAFVVGRLVSAMVRAEPDAPMTPVRRFSIGLICGVLIGALVVAIFGVVGVFSPGGAKSWRKPNSLIVEKETGARYVLVDGQLRPVLNYASARLILKGEPIVARVSRKSLKGVPHGLPVGIQAAPDSLPDLKRGDGKTWQACSSMRPDVSGAPKPFVTLSVGARPPGRWLGPENALLVRAPDGTLYLGWNGRRLLLPAPWMQGALGYASARPHQVGWSWLNGVPAGPDLGAPDIPDRGQRGPTIDGHRTVVGQLFEAARPEGGSQQYVVRADGLSPLAPTAAALLLADPRTRNVYPAGQVRAIGVSSSALALAPRSKEVAGNQQHPSGLPELIEIRTGEMPCVQLVMNAADGPTVRLGVRAAPSSGGAVAPPRAGDRLLADQIVVAAGAGLLIREQPAPGVADGAVYLLVDTGVRYPLPSEEATETLGYRNVNPTPVPGPLLALLPVGPPLDPAAAHATEQVARPPVGGAAG
jgi:type VII secretion protein EccB